MKRILPCSFFQARARFLDFSSPHIKTPETHPLYQRSFLRWEFVASCFICEFGWHQHILKSAESAGYMLTVLQSHVKVALLWQNDGHAIARISPGAPFGECLGCGLELIWMHFVAFFLQTKSDMDIYLYLDILDIRLAMLGVSPVCNSDWYPCHNATLLDNLVAKTCRNGPSPFELSCWLVEMFASISYGGMLCICSAYVELMKVQHIT